MGLLAIKPEPTKSSIAKLNYATLGIMDDGDIITVIDKGGGWYTVINLTANTVHTYRYDELKLMNCEPLKDKTILEWTN